MKNEQTIALVFLAIFLTPSLLGVWLMALRWVRDEWRQL